jgi:uncharacterized protein (TIGR03118 family)
MHSSSRARLQLGEARRWCGAVAVVAAVGLTLASPALARDGGGGRGDLGRYAQRNLVSDVPGAAELTDSNLVNAWGLTFGPSTPAWVADNGTDVSTLYSGGVGSTPVTKVPITVSIPGGAPTGAVFNGSTGFVVHSGTSAGPARFLFSSEAGTITGWNPAVPPPPTSMEAQTAVTVPGAIFKGLAIADTATGPQIYASDFHNGAVDVWDANFAPVKRAGAFTDPGLPAGYAPFGIQTVTGGIVVTYAKQDADAHDDVAGPRHGFVDVYTTAGSLVRRFASRGSLDSPWGIAVAPSGFGLFSGDILIGNFGNGKISAFNAKGRFQGFLTGSDGNAVEIPGLWGLGFGNDAQAGPSTTLYFAAGPGDESHGLFGTLTPGKHRHTITAVTGGTTGGGGFQY